MSVEETRWQDGNRAPIVSCEEHFSTPELESALARLHGAAGARRHYAARLLELAEGRIEEMDRAGIATQVLSLATPGVQDFKPDEALSLAYHANDRLAEAVADAPTRLSGIAVAPPQAPEAGAVELERAVTQLGLKGLVIHSHTSGEYLDDPKFWPLLEAAEALAVPVYLHPRAPSSNLAGAALEIPGFRVGWSFAIETGTHALRMIAAGVFDRFPNLQVILGHMGELLPFAIPRIDARFTAEGVTARLGKPALTPGQYLRRNFLVTTSGMNSWPQLRMTMEVIGLSRVLFAADYPFEDQTQAAAALRSFPMDETDRAALAGGNAARVFGLF